MRNIETFDDFVKFPQKEFATAFIAKSNSPFRNASIGLTYPSHDYHIERNAPPPYTCLNTCWRVRGNFGLTAGENER